MSVAAIICEYNPFHKGHKYHIDEIKKKHDSLICVMSGAFVQRGEPAIFDKWTRAKAALLNGCDLVIELPVCYALNTAGKFASGAVELIDKLGIVDSLSFGSESGNTEKLIKACNILINEPREVSLKMQNLLKSGLSFPKARQEAFFGLIDEDILSKPNNILALEYIKALKKLNSNITPETIKRIASDYHETTPTSDITSASAIRTLINNNDSFRTYVPENVYDIYSKLSPANINELNNILLYILRTTTAEKLMDINDVLEGLENRLIQSAKECSGIEEITSFVKSKRYTYTKISRILMSVILNITKDIPSSPIEYARILGMNQKGMNLLGKIKEKSDLAIITKPADFKNFNKSFELDVFSGEIYSMCYKNNDIDVRDYYNSPVIIK